MADDPGRAPLYIVTVPPGAAAVDVARRAAADRARDDLLVVVPEGRARVQVDAVDLHEALADAGVVAVRTAEGDVVVGLAGALAGDGGAGAPLVDALGVEVLVHRWSPHDGSSIVLAGRVLATAVSAEPAVVVADEADAAGLVAALAEDHGRDLVRVLRYDDAVDTGPDEDADGDDGDGWGLVADEVLDVPFWTPAFCATVIRAAEATGAFTAQDGDPVPGQEVSLATIAPALFDAVQQHVALAVMPLAQQVWPYAEYHGLRDAFVIKYAPGAQTELRMHHDVAQLSGSVKLNDGYQGCRLEFPRQGFDNDTTPVGRMLVWPSLVTHPHRATPLTGGVKYALTVWFELPGGTDPAVRHRMTRT